MIILVSIVRGSESVLAQSSSYDLMLSVFQDAVSELHKSQHATWVLLAYIISRRQPSNTQSLCVIAHSGTKTSSKSQ